MPECPFCGYAEGNGHEPLCLGGATIRGPLESGRQARDKALENVERGAGPEWNALADRIVRELIEERETFSSDDVWDAGLPKPREGRALGAVLMRFSRLGLIEKTGRTVTTRQRNCHAQPITLWRSRVYRGAAA